MSDGVDSMAHSLIEKKRGVNKYGRNRNEGSDGESGGFDRSSAVYPAVQPEDYCRQIRRQRNGRLRVKATGDSGCDAAETGRI